MNYFKRYLKINFLLLLVVINIFIYFYINNISEAKLTVAFLDVGQGDAIFIEAPTGLQMLIDGGANNKVLGELGKLMPFYDRSIDVVLATHADQDHIGGLVEVLKRFDVGIFVRTGATSSSAVYAELERVIREKNIKEEIISEIKIISLGDGVELDILFPNQEVSSWEKNEASIVSKLVYGQNSFLLTGDAPKISEKYLVNKYGLFLDTDVLKLGHHGSKTSSSEIFVGMASPLYSVISAGLDNRYGHPSPEVMDILAKFKNQILQTINLGTIIFESDGQNLFLK